MAAAALTFTIKISGSSPLAIETTAEDCKTCAHLKALIATKSGMPPDQQKLVFKGKVLLDKDVLADKKIGDKATIFLVKGSVDRSSGSGSTGTPADSDKKEEKKEDAPEEKREKCKGNCGFFVSDMDVSISQSTKYLHR